MIEGGTDIFKQNKKYSVTIRTEWNELQFNVLFHQMKQFLIKT